MTTLTAAITPVNTEDSVSVNAAANSAGDTDVVAHYRAESRRSLAQVDAAPEGGKLEGDELAAASQALWDAAAKRG